MVDDMNPVVTGSQYLDPNGQRWAEQQPPEISTLIHGICEFYFQQQKGLGREHSLKDLEMCQPSGNLYNG